MRRLYEAPCQHDKSKLWLTAFTKEIEDLLNDTTASISSTVDKIEDASWVKRISSSNTTPKETLLKKFAQVIGKKLTRLEPPQSLEHSKVLLQPWVKINV